MAVGWPLKTSFANGNSLPASDLNDITGTVNNIYSSGTYPNQLSYNTSGNIRPIPLATSAGVKTISTSNISAGGSVNVSVTFATSNRFNHAPIVVVSLGNIVTNSQNVVARVNNESTTGFDIYLYNAGSSGTGAITNLDVNWIAINMVSASADDS